MAHLAPGFFDQVHLLLDTEKEDIDAFFKDVFIDHKLWEFKDFLWDALETCLSSNDAPFESADVRKDAIFQMFIVVKCLEAGKLIADRSNKKEKKPVAQDPAEKYKNIDSLTPEELKEAHRYFGEQISVGTTYYGKVTDRIIQVSREQEYKNLPG
jgi:hypothetical protein